MGGLKAEAISVNRKEEVNAKSVIGDKRLEGLQIVEVAKDGFVDTIREMEANGEMREGESADDLIAELRNGDTFGVIVGGKYIVTDAKAAAKNLAEGKLYQGTVFSHEVKHAADLKAFTPDEMRVYSTNLQEWTKENAAPIHAEAVARLVGNKAVWRAKRNSTCWIRKLCSRRFKEKTIQKIQRQVIQKQSWYNILFTWRF